MLADRHQGRSLPNPELDLAIRSRGSGERDFEYTLLEDLKGVLLYPLNRGLANSRYAQARMRLADDLLENIAQVKAAYFELQGLLQALSLQRSTLQAAEASATLATRQLQAGNINALEEAMHRAVLGETKLEVEHLEAETQIARQLLGQLLGLSGEGWQVAEALPLLPEEDLELAAIEELALSQRPDLGAAREEVQAARQARQISRFSVFPSLQVGVNAKKEDDHHTAGPALALELPLFDWGQATRARARTSEAQSHHQLRAQEGEARTQVRAIGGPLPPGSRRAPAPALVEEENPPQSTPTLPHHH